LTVFLRISLILEADDEKLVYSDIWTFDRLYPLLAYFVYLSFIGNPLTMCHCSHQARDVCTNQVSGMIFIFVQTTSSFSSEWEALSCQSC